jgi:hypothetical protein
MGTIPLQAKGRWITYNGHFEHNTGLGLSPCWRLAYREKTSLFSYTTPGLPVQAEG